MQVSYHYYYYYRHVLCVVSLTYNYMIVSDIPASGVKFVKPSEFRESLLTLMTKGRSIESTAGTRLVSTLMMKVEEVFQKYDVNMSGTLDYDAISLMLRDLGMSNADVSRLFFD
jgi:hypothetical protein